MTADPESYVRAAQSHLDVAQFCHDGKHFGTAVAEAYHSVLASVKVRLLRRDKAVPKSHPGVLSRLYYEFVDTGDLPRERHSFVHEMQTYRDDWNYEANVPPSSKSARALETASEVKTLIDPNGPSERQVVPAT